MEQQDLILIREIVTEVKSALAAKQLEISKVSNCIPFVINAFKKRQREVISFERSVGSVRGDAPSITIFRQAASELLGEISKILV